MKTRRWAILRAHRPPWTIFTRIRTAFVPRTCNKEEGHLTIPRRFDWKGMSWSVGWAELSFACIHLLHRVLRQEENSMITSGSARCHALRLPDTTIRCYGIQAAVDPAVSMYYRPSKRYVGGTSLGRTVPTRRLRAQREPWGLSSGDGWPEEWMTRPAQRRPGGSTQCHMARCSAVGIRPVRLGSIGLAPGCC